MNEAAPKPGREPERTPDQYQAEGLISPEAVREDDTTQSLIAELHRAAELLSAAIRAADPDAMGPYPHQPIASGGRPSGRADDRTPATGEAPTAAAAPQ